MQSDGRRLHGLAAQARERREFETSLGLIFQALKAYQKDGDKLGYSEALCDASISLRNEADLENDPDFLIVAKHFIMAAIEIAERNEIKDALAIPYFNLGKVQETLGQTADAIESYKKAVEYITSNPPASNNRAAVVADFKSHLAIAELKNSDQSAYDRVLEAIKDLESVEILEDDSLPQGSIPEFNQEFSYNQHVWLSGAHIDLAVALRDKDPEKAKEHLAKAKEIIDNDPKLTIRKKQYEKLASQF